MRNRRFETTQPRFYIRRWFFVKLGGAQRKTGSRQLQYVLGCLFGYTCAPYYSKIHISTVEALRLVLRRQDTNVVVPSLAPPMFVLCDQHDVFTGSPSTYVHLLAYLTLGFQGSPAQDVLSPLDWNYTRPNRGTPRKSTTGLCDGRLSTPPWTPNAARSTSNTREPVTSSTPSLTNAMGPALDARPCADRVDGRAANGAPSVRTPEVPGRAAADSGRGFRSSGRKPRPPC